jgi:hypothetical protein
MRTTDTAGCGLLAGGVLLLLFLPAIAIFGGGLLGLVESPGEALLLAVLVVGPFVLAHRASSARKRRGAAASDAQEPSSTSDTE